MRTKHGHYGRMRQTIKSLSIHNNKTALQHNHYQTCRHIPKKCNRLLKKINPEQHQNAGSEKKPKQQQTNDTKWTAQTHPSPQTTQIKNNCIKIVLD